MSTECHAVADMVLLKKNGNQNGRWLTGCDGGDTRQIADFTGHFSPGEVHRQQNMRNFPPRIGDPELRHNAIDYGR